MRKNRETKTVLVIEDEATFRDFASQVLKLEGYRVLTAADSTDGTNIAKKKGVNLVLLDLRLSQSDGWSVLAQLKNQPALAAIPVVVLTASAGAQHRDRALSLGAADYLVKPVSAATLRETVARILACHGRS